MKLCSRHREAAPGNSGGGVSLSGKEQLGLTQRSPVQSVPPSKQGSPQTLQRRGGLDITTASQERCSHCRWLAHACLLPVLGEKQEREGRGPGCCQEEDAASVQTRHSAQRQTDGAAVSVTLRVIRKAARRLNNLAKKIHVPGMQPILISSHSLTLPQR